MSESAADLNVIDLLSHIPVRQIGGLTAREAGERLATLLRLFDVDCDVDERGGVTFGVDGTDPEDEALVQALVTLLQRRHGPAT